METLLPILQVLKWPLVAVLGLIMFRRPVIDALARLRKLKVPTIELVLDQLEKQTGHSVGARSELAGLSAHDIWALDDFANKKITSSVVSMKPAQRVIARTLCDMKLAEIVDQGETRMIQVTQLGHDILKAANSLL